MIEEKLTDLELKRLEHAGITYPWHPRQARRLLDEIRELKNEVVMVHAILEWIERLVDGEEVSDFAESFPVVLKVSDLVRRASDSAKTKD